MIHWGSEKALAQRVPLFPSTAAAAGVPSFSWLEAVTVFPCESSVGAALAGTWGTKARSERTRPAMTASTAPRLPVGAVKGLWRFGGAYKGIS
ncbi:hypothetical protein EES40_27565 [Streptomyces sp. ADI93-02]|nr:hypothetical protein EES40_27565 [Streptomyces sp. ADI93-02]